MTRVDLLGSKCFPSLGWDEQLSVSPQAIKNMEQNPVYRDMPWRAYRNMWWILDPMAGEFCAVGIHGQVIYINRAADVVMVWYSSQPDASAAVSPPFPSKIKRRQNAGTVTDKSGRTKPWQ